MKNKDNNLKGVFSLLVVAFLAFSTAIAHTACIFIGASCYQIQRAPGFIVDSAIQNTWLAPVATLGVSFLFVLCGLYALSGAGYIRRIPFFKTAMVVISLLCIVRGVATIPLLMMFPQEIGVFSVSAGIVWTLAGMLNLYGLFVFHKNHNS